MPLYCENCMKLVDKPVCPHCRSRRLREVEPGDFCLAADVHYMQAEMLKELFHDNDIPCTERSALGAGIVANLGVNVGTVRLYVPYDRLDSAKERYDAYFNGTQEEPQKPRELLLHHVYRHFKGGTSSFSSFGIWFGTQKTVTGERFLTSSSPLQSKISPRFG